MEENSYGYGFDPLWLNESVANTGSLRAWYEQHYSDGFPRPKTTYVSTTPNNGDAKRRLTELLNKYAGEILPETKKEKPIMGSYDNNRTAQQQIDDEVRKAIEAPRIKAEVAKRVALVSALETLEDAPVGTVLTFGRTYDKVTYSVAAIKNVDGYWAVTGDGYNSSSGQRYTFQQLVDSMTTGSKLAENVQVASAFVAPEASATTDAPTASA